MNQKYKIGDVIEIYTSRLDTIPGVKKLKSGKFQITNFRKGFSMPTMVYDFKSVRKNSTYEYAISQEWVEENSKLI